MEDASEGGASRCDWRVYERDVDVLLAEEISVSSKFRAWLCDRTALLSGRALELADVSVSYADNYGESDLVVVFRDSATGERLGLLIENKVDAVFQPQQPERYRLRAEAGARNGAWDKFEIMLCAPRGYLDRSAETQKFDVCVSYEEISGFLEDLGDRRSLYRAGILRNAAPRGASAYVQPKDEITDRFWLQAYELARKEFPELEMKKPDYAANQTWIGFRPADFPKSVYVRLKGSQGFVDLEFGGRDHASISAAWPEGENLPYTIHQTGKSAVFRRTVEPFTVDTDFENSRGRVLGAFRAASELIEFYRKHRERFRPVAGA